MSVASQVSEGRRDAGLVELLAGVDLFDAGVVSVFAEQVESLGEGVVFHHLGDALLEVDQLQID